MSPWAVCDPGDQQFDRRPKTMMAMAGDDGRGHEQPEIAWLDELDLLPIETRLPARLRDQAEADAAGDQGQLQVIPLDFRAEVEMSALAIERALQRRSEAASPRIEHPAIETKLNHSRRCLYRRLAGRDNDDWLLREASQLQ